MDYKLISCDDHLDLNQLPADLWTKGLPAEFKDRAPHIEELNGRAVWVCEGENWGGWSGKGSAFSGPKPIFTALDRGGIVDQTERRPGVPELRLADMDRDGVHAHVIFGPVTSIKTSDEALRDACYRAYNDWLQEYCSVAPAEANTVTWKERIIPESSSSWNTGSQRGSRNGGSAVAICTLACLKQPLAASRCSSFSAASG